MNDWNGKRVLILGAARQGLALARWLAAQGASVTLSDTRGEAELRAAREALRTTLLEGDVLGPRCLRVQGVKAYSVLRDPKTGRRTAVLVNARAKPVDVELAGFENGSTPAIVWALPSI